MNIPKFYVIAQYPLMHKVIMHLYVLCLSMENEILGKLYPTYVVATD